MVLFSLLKNPVKLGHSVGFIIDKARGKLDMDKQYGVIILDKSEYKAMLARAAEGSIK